MTIPFEQIKAELLADPEVKREYDALASEFEALAKSIRAKQAQKSRRKATIRAIKAAPPKKPVQ